MKAWAKFSEPKRGWYCSAYFRGYHLALYMQWWSPQLREFLGKSGFQWISHYPTVSICAKISVFPRVQANMHTLVVVVVVGLVGLLNKFTLQLSGMGMYENLGQRLTSSIF